MESVATALIDLVDTLDAPSFSMVGYSMGGRIALYVASIYAMRVDALVLESSSPGLRSETERAERRATDERWARMLEDDGMKTFLDAWYEQPLFASLVSRADLIEQIKTKRLANNPRALARALRGFSVGRQAPLWDEWTANLIPTLIVAGELDVKYSVLAHEMVLLSRKSSYTMFQNVGHNVHEEAPDAYNRVIHAFLDETIKV